MALSELPSLSPSLSVVAADAALPAVELLLVELVDVELPEVEAVDDPASE